MNTFLKEVSKKIIKTVNSIEDCIIVLPNKRSRLFLLENLSDLLNAPLIAPKIMTIEEFILDLSEINKATRIELLLKLHKVYISNTPLNERDSFEDFLNWASPLLKDFSDLDSNLVDPSMFFKDLVSYEKLGEWTKNKKNNNRFNLKFYTRLSVYYLELKKELYKNGIGTSGMLYKKAVDGLNIYIESSDKKHFFVGFNVLNNAESIIFQEFLETGKGEIFWDIDSHFSNDNNHSNGIFIRDYLKNWKYYRKNKYNFFSNSYTDNKNIEIVGLPNNISQAKFVGQKISKFFLKNNLSSTAVILGDEELLIPVLSGFPKKSHDFNISIGLPIINASSTSFFNSFFDLHNSYKDGFFYYENLLKILNLKWLKDLFIQDGDIINSIIKEINLNNLELVKAEYLLNIFSKKNKLKYLIFEPSKTTIDFIEKCLKILNEIEVIDQKTYDKMFFEEFKIIFKKLNNIISINQEFDSIKNLKYFFNEIIIDEKIPFIGNSLKGIQIMGLLGSRNLDFENLIITNLNEGIFPKQKVDFSFFPYELKKHYKLPTFKELDAIYSYQFYHLIKRAKNIILLYSTNRDSVSGNEKSRFLYQLEHENIETHNLNIYKKNFEISPNKDNRDFVNKTNEILKHLIKMGENGFSASSLSNFLANPLDFYYKRILKIDEEEVLDFEVNFMDRGTIIHETLEELYLPYRNKYLKGKDFDNMKLKLDSVIKKIFKKKYRGGNYINGRNLLLIETLKKSIIDFLLVEKKLVKKGHKIKILDLEKSFDQELSFLNFPFPTKLIGKIDRIDLFDNSYRIIDYKTGLIEPKDMILKNWSDLKNNFKMAPVFQLILYSYVTKKFFKKKSNVFFGIISLRNPKSYFMKLFFDYNNQLNKTNKLNEEIIEDFEVFLNNIFDEIYDINVPFKLLK